MRLGSSCRLLHSTAMSHRLEDTTSRPSPSHPLMQKMDQMPYQRQNSLMSGVSNMTSGSIQDNEFSTQGDLPLRPNSHCGHGTPNDFTHYWALQEAAVLDNGSVSSQQFVPSTAGQGDLLYHNVSEFPAAQDVTPQNDFDFAHAHQDFHTYSPLADLVFDTDVCPQNGSQSYDDTLSVGQTSQADDKQMISAQDAWNSLQGSPMDQLSSNVFPALPVSPPLSEASSDICVTSSCSSSGYTSFIANDDALFADITTPVGSQGISLGDPLFPISPPLTEHDPNRLEPTFHLVIRRMYQFLTYQTGPSDLPNNPVGQTWQRPSLSPMSKQTQKIISRCQFGGLLGRGPRTLLNLRTPGIILIILCQLTVTGNTIALSLLARNLAITLQRHRNAPISKYHLLPLIVVLWLILIVVCSKYLDSHLKPYRCKVPACMDAQLQFSSNACLFRHEREAHGFHGHGDNPHLCLFEGCERSIPGYGFPRRWNLFDHMRRVHDFASVEQLSSPENSPAIGKAAKRKETSARKRRVNGVTGAQVMKRTRSNQSQASSGKSAHSSHNGQRLLDAERNYFNCRARLLEELSHITPQDSAMHEKVNASLQELITLGLNYRHIEASQMASQV